MIILDNNYKPKQKFNKKDDPLLLENYAVHNQKCEFSWWLKGIIQDNHTELEIHHIEGGCYRSDELSNIIRIHRRYHSRENIINIHSNHNMKITAYAIKLMKGEISEGWLEYFNCHHEVNSMIDCLYSTNQFFYQRCSNVRRK